MGRQAALVVVVAGLVSGCHTIEAPTTTAAAGRQSLFRLEVGRGGQLTHVRLVLREEVLGDQARAWELSVVDGLGRTAWQWLANGDEGVWVERRTGRWCSQWLGSSVFGVPPGVDAEVLRRVLRGESPRNWAKLPEGSSSRTAPEGRWELEVRNGRVVGWRLEQGGQSWSWLGDATAGSLESADGFLARWRRLVVEPLAPGTVVVGKFEPGDLVHDCAAPALP